METKTVNDVCISVTTLTVAGYDIKPPYHHLKKKKILLKILTVQLALFCSCLCFATLIDAFYSMLHLPDSGRPRRPLEHQLVHTCLLHSSSPPTVHYNQQVKGEEHLFSMHSHHSTNNNQKQHEVMTFL